MTFWDHLAELRRRLIWSVALLLAGSVVGLIFYDWMLEEIFLPP